MAAGSGIVGVINEGSAAIGTGYYERTLGLLIIAVHCEHRQVRSQPAVGPVDLPTQLKVQQGFLVKDAERTDGVLTLIWQRINRCQQPCIGASRPRSACGSDIKRMAVV